MCEVIAAKWLNFLFPTMGYTAALLRQARSKRKALIECSHQGKPPNKSSASGNFKAGSSNVQNFDGISSSSDDEDVGDLFASSDSDKDVEVDHNEHLDTEIRENAPSRTRNFGLVFDEATSFGLSSDSESSDVSSTSISSDSDDATQRRADKPTPPNRRRLRKVPASRPPRVAVFDSSVSAASAASAASSLSSTSLAARDSLAVPSDDSVSAIDSFPESDSFSDLEHLDLGAINDRLSSSDESTSRVQ